MPQHINNFSYYYGRVDEPSPVPYRGVSYGCNCSNELILSKISELEEKLKTGLDIDTSDLETIIENKIEQVVDRNNSQLADTIETIATKVQENTESLADIEEKIDTMEEQLDDIYSEMFGKKCQCVTNGCHQNNICFGNLYNHK